MSAAAEEPPKTPPKQPHREAGDLESLAVLAIFRAARFLTKAARLRQNMCDHGMAARNRAIAQVLANTGGQIP